MNKRGVASSFQQSPIFATEAEKTRVKKAPLTPTESMRKSSMTLVTIIVLPRNTAWRRNVVLRTLQNSCQRKPTTTMIFPPAMQTRAFDENCCLRRRRKVNAGLDLFWGGQNSIGYSSVGQSRAACKNLGKKDFGSRRTRHQRRICRTSKT